MSGFQDLQVLMSLLGLQWDWGQFRIFSCLFLGEKIILQGSISTSEALLHWQNKLTSYSWIAEHLSSFEQFFDNLWFSVVYSSAVPPPIFLIFLD